MANLLESNIGPVAPVSDRTGVDGGLALKWRERLRDPEALTPLPIRKAASSGERHFVQERISRGIAPSALIDRFAGICSVETAMVAAWSYLLSVYTSEETVFFGVRPGNAADSDWMEPMFVSVPREETVRAWLGSLQMLVTDPDRQPAVALPQLHLWCEIPLEQLLVESVVDFGAPDSAAPQACSPALRLYAKPDSPAFLVGYRTDCFERETIARLGEQFSTVLESMASALDRPVAEIDFLPEAERRRVVVEWNRTGAEFPKGITLKKWVESQAARIPKVAAVIHPERDGATISYRELNENANALALNLQALGARPGVVVGVCAERSVEMIVAVLAIIKTGAAYVPLDPTYPKDRLLFMLEDTAAPIILTTFDPPEMLPKTGAKLIHLDRATIGKESENPAASAGPDDLVYLIYTSGSTGKPKGVAMRQEPLVNLLQWQEATRKSPATSRTLQFSSLNFDVSFQEIFSTLCSGGTLVLISEQTRRDSSALVSFLERERVNRLFLPYVALKHLAEASAREECVPSSLVEIITAGEQLQVTPQVVSLLRSVPGCVLENQYGPSETHVVTAFRLEKDPDRWPVIPPIGRPVANCTAYILDPRLRPVPIGVPGEIYLGGVCLARGYLNRPEITAERFVADPFAGNSAARMYKTGDLARFLPDGNIEFLGRIDNQVKIRGFRVELGEIEAVLAGHDSVREAVVVTRENPAGEKQLAAYVVPQNGSVSSRELRDFLRQRLPSYAVPAFFSVIETLPLTPSGKVDRRSLPAPKPVEEENTGTGRLPQTPLEMRLKLVFERFLNFRPVATDMTFFEMGGDSLQALRLIVEIERAIGKKMPLEVLYQAPTIEKLARRIETQDDGAVHSCFVPLQTSGTRPPLYLIHTTPGDVLGYGNLIFHLGADQPCYGLQSLGLVAREQAQTSIAEMAAHYVSLIRKHQPRGPYHLAGWCYGGIVATEMAHQLIAAGERIAVLGLIETPAPSPGLKNIPFYLRRLGCLLNMTPPQWVKYFGNKFRYYRGVRRENEMRFKRAGDDHEGTPEEIARRNEWLDLLEFVYHRNMTALAGYRSRYYPEKIVLFNAAEQDPALVRDAKYGWPGLAREIQIHVVPGDHDSILMEPNVRVLADQLSRCIDDAMKRYPTADLLNPLHAS
jgi:amino acid adenylation domain-containing protein